jgi:hypothetical protein
MARLRFVEHDRYMVESGLSCVKSRVDLLDSGVDPGVDVGKFTAYVDILLLSRHYQFVVRQRAVLHVSIRAAINLVTLGEIATVVQWHVLTRRLEVDLT